MLSLEIIKTAGNYSEKSLDSSGEFYSGKRLSTS